MAGSVIQANNDIRKIETNLRDETLFVIARIMLASLTISHRYSKIIVTTVPHR
jgi:hypothetical protein